jgi:molecular chaperone DnaK
MNELAIGIDLGTSNSCVAVLRGGAIEVLPNGYGEYTTASVVAIKPNGSVVVGNAAKANIIHDPKHTVYSSKRLIGRYFFSEEVKKARAICSYEIAEAENHGVRIRIREELFSLPEIGAMVLRELKQIAEMHLGRAVNKAVITVPANFNDNQRQATKDAGRIAGLEVLRIMNEPTAAALAYGFGKGLSQRVAIYDLGGGTFDISVLEIADDVFEVLATCGDTFLGGDDFDDRLIDLLADEFMQKEQVNLRNDPFALEKLKVAAEEAKKALSVESEVEIRIPDIYTAAGRSPCSIQRTLTEREFSQLVNDLILRTFKVCDEALQQAGVIARDLDGVILVGGPTRLPMIREAVRSYFQKEPKTDVDPDQVVAMGAAIHAASLISSDQEAFLLDVTPLSLRIGVAGDMAESVIERNTPVPIEQTRTFTTFQDNQESVQIRVYQGESRVAHENELLGQFEFSGFRKARRGEVAIDVTFEINADGIVNVTARDQETGKQSSTSITLSSGLSEGELKSIIEGARTDRVQTSSPGGEVAARASEARSEPKASEVHRSAAGERGSREPAAAVPALPPAAPAAQRAAVERRSQRPPAKTAAPPPPVAVRSAPQPPPRPVAAPQKPLHPEPELDVTEPQLDAAAAPAKIAPDEAPTDEHRVFEALTERGSDLAPDPVDDSLDLLGDDDLAALTPEIDLVDAEPAPPASDAASGLFDSPGTDLSTLPDPDARKKS